MTGKHQIFQVDAFTDQVFAGNPAAVCLPAESRDAEWMHALARELNRPPPRLSRSREMCSASAGSHDARTPAKWDWYPVFSPCAVGNWPGPAGPGSEIRVAKWSSRSPLGRRLD